MVDRFTGLSRSTAGAGESGGEVVVDETECGCDGHVHVKALVGAQAPAEVDVGFGGGAGAVTPQDGAIVEQIITRKLAALLPPDVPGVELDPYCATLLDRLGNRSLLNPCTVMRARLDKMVDYLLRSLHASRARNQPIPTDTGRLRLGAVPARHRPPRRTHRVKDTRYDELAPCPSQEPATRGTCSDAETSSGTLADDPDFVPRSPRSPRSPTWSPASTLRACTQQSEICYRSRSSRTHRGRPSLMTSMVDPWLVASSRARFQPSRPHVAACRRRRGFEGFCYEGR